MIDPSLVFDGTFNANGSVNGVALTNTTTSTNTIDWLVGRDMGAGALLAIHLDVTQTFAGGTSLQVDLEVGATAGGTFFALALSPVIPVAQLIAGSPIFRIGYPLNQVLNAVAGIRNTPGRYVRLNYTIVGTMTAGAVFAWMTPIEDRDQFTVYNNNYTANTIL
jgi:hypothetical protein